VMMKARARRAAYIGASTVVGLAGTALIVHVRARQSERTYPPRGRFIDVDSVRLHYLERGEGPVVVLLHGNGMRRQI
jgi:hypothetical protein